MSKDRESAAERLWREKVDLCGSLGECIVLAALAGTFASFVLIGYFW